MKPLKFKPILKQTLWGGSKIAAFKHIDDNTPNVGESWELSGVKGNVSICTEGDDVGKTLEEIIAIHGDALLGKDNHQAYGNEFPLLVKLIDAQKDLSIQVHPNDETSVRLGYDRGKTEMWYLLESDDNAQLYAGLNKEITVSEYKQHVADNTICDVLSSHSVAEGDCFFLPAGRIHSIGAGCFLAEIQQTSDVTFRIYDFNRRDKDGNLRQLHTEEAAQAIDYHVYDDYRTTYTPRKNEAVDLVACPYFNTALYDIDEPMTLDYSSLDSFVILIGLKGKATLTVCDDSCGTNGANGSYTTSLNAGETVLIPACTQQVKVEGEAKFLETFV